MKLKASGGPASNYGASKGLIVVLPLKPEKISLILPIPIFKVPESI